MTAPSTFPEYAVPPNARERYPEFDPADPATWPEPDRCTEGRPWGLSVYGGRLTARDAANRWESYLANASLGRPCRNRWKDARYRLCGTHLNPYLNQAIREERRRRSEERRLRHVDLAKQLGAFGIVADGQASGVLLQADAVEALVRILAEADRVAPL